MHTFRVKKARNLWENSIGLLGSSKPYPILLETRFGIHTLGMKYPIDVIILDKNSQIKAMKQDLKPGRFYFWNPILNQVLELPGGTITKLKIKIGNSVNLQYI